LPTGNAQAPVTKPPQINTDDVEPSSSDDGQKGKCGFRNKDGLGFRIMEDGEGDSAYGEFPWMVGVLEG
jgi:hypothetical protein